MRCSNDWEVSYIRRWLNNEFYYDSFNDMERNFIQYSQISNSIQSGYSDFAQDRPDTRDNIIYKQGGTTSSAQKS